MNIGQIGVAKCKDCGYYQDGFCLMNSIRVSPESPACTRFKAAAGPKQRIRLAGISWSKGLVYAGIIGFVIWLATKK